MRELVVMTDQQTTALVAYDGSTAADAAIDALASLSPGCSATVLTVWVPITGNTSEALLAIPPAIVKEASEKFDAEAESRAREQASAGAERARGLGLQAEPVTKPSDDNIGASILAAADEMQSSVIVAGAQGHSRLARFVLGSVSNQLVHQSSRPVLVVNVPE